MPDRRISTRTYLILSTIHSAKGQKWKNVFVLNAVDGCMPIDLSVGTTEDIEEKRRLLYVAMTRAKDGLHLITPQRFFKHGQSARGDRHVYASRTRFIPASILSTFEQTLWPAARPGEGPQRHPRSGSTLAPGCAECGNDVPNPLYERGRAVDARRTRGPSILIVIVRCGLALTARSISASAARCPIS